MYKIMMSAADLSQEPKTAVSPIVTSKETLTDDLLAVGPALRLSNNL